MRRTCSQCGVDQFVSDEKLSAGWVFLKCHGCQATSAIQGKASQALAKWAEKPLRTEAPKPVELPPAPDFLGTKKTNLSPTEIAEPTLVMLEPHSEAEPENEPETEIEVEAQPATRSRTRVFASAALAVLCFASGAYLLKTASALRAQNAWLASVPEQVENKPVPQAAPAASTSAPVAAAIPPAATASSAGLAAPAQPQTPAAAGTVAQTPAAPSMKKSMNAVAAIKRSLAAEKDEGKVQIMAPSAILRAGPGTNFNKVGVARAELQFMVRGTFNDWIEIKTGSGAQTAWIRKDLVKPIAMTAGESR